MEIVIDNTIRVIDPRPDLIAWCKDHLVIPNPEYGKKTRMHKWVGDTPKTISLLEKDGDDLLLPYGCLTTVAREFYNFSTDRCIEMIPEAVSVDFGGCEVPLYDYQRQAVSLLRLAGGGILQSPAGSGKTQMGIALAAQLQKKTLWITHTHDLLNQSKARAEQYMPSELMGTITEGSVHIGSAITFATVQTLSALDLVRYQYIWDVIIVDECHRVAGTPTAMTQFSKVLNALSAHHKYGLSATVHRSDGMIAATYALLGDIAHKVPESAVADKIMKVLVQAVPTPLDVSTEFLNTDGTICYAKLVNYLTEDINRNGLIIQHLFSNLEHSNLILSDRLSHLEYLMEHLPPSAREQAVMISGKMTTKKGKAAREQAIEDMRTGRKRYLFATYSLAKEGLDIPCLDRLYLTTPQTDYAVVAQSIGRVARTCEGKGQPIAYDFVDERIMYLARSYKKRCTTYRKIGCRLE